MSRWVCCTFTQSIHEQQVREPFWYREQSLCLRSPRLQNKLTVMGSDSAFGHSRHTSTYSLRSLLRPAVVLRVVPIYSHFHRRGWNLTDSPAPNIPPATASSSICLCLRDRRPQSTHAKTQKANKQPDELHPRTSRVLLVTLRKFREGAERQKPRILSWMSIHFKGRNKKRLGCVSQRLYTKALAPLSTHFQKAGDTLADISTRQRPLSWQSFLFFFFFSREV